MSGAGDGGLWPALRRATPARIGLGRVGAGLPTRAHLDFVAAHALARDAAHASFDAARLCDEMSTLGLEPLALRSAAADRPTYLRRPDLGRRLDPASRQLLNSRTPESIDIAFVIADGLSATAVNRHAVSVLTATIARLDPAWRIGPVAVVTGGRVAIGDEIGGILCAGLTAVLIGERPGLSAADSLGIYLTRQPVPGSVDAARNCISNIHGAGLPIAAAAEQLAGLIAAARRHRATGIALGQRLAAAPALPAAGD